MIAPFLLLLFVYVATCGVVEMAQGDETFAAFVLAVVTGYVMVDSGLLICRCWYRKEREKRHGAEDR